MDQEDQIETKLYLMPGMGLDQDIFESIDLPECERIEMNWFEPDYNESLEAYIIRLIQKYKIRSKDKNVFIGHSFGGIVVQEIAKRTKAEEVLIISSVKSPEEIPFKIKMLKYVPMHNALTQGAILDTLFIWGTAHGFNTKAKRDRYRTKILMHSNYYYKWAITEMIAWRNKDDIGRKIIHIHGDKDLTFPISNIKEVIRIKDGNHMMLWDQGKEINQIIQDELRLTLVGD